MTDSNPETRREQGRSPDEYRRVGASALRTLLDMTGALMPTIPDPDGGPAGDGRLRSAMVDAVLDAIDGRPERAKDGWQRHLAAALQVWLAGDSDILAAVLATAADRLDRRRSAAEQGYVAGRRSMVRWLRTMAHDPAATGLDADTMRRILADARAFADSAAERHAPPREQAPTVSVAAAAEAVRSLRAPHAMETPDWYRARQVAADEFERVYDLGVDGRPASHARPRPAAVRHGGLKCRTCNTEIAYDQAAVDPDRCAACQPSRTP